MAPFHTLATSTSDYSEEFHGVKMNGLHVRSYLPSSYLEKTAEFRHGEAFSSDKP